MGQSMQLYLNNLCVMLADGAPLLSQHRIKCLAATLCIFLTSSGHAQVATYQSPQLHIPLVLVGEQSLEVTMTQSLTNPNELSLLSFSDSNATLESNAASYEGTTLTIQDVRVGEENYAATLELVQEEPAIFRLSASSLLPEESELTPVITDSDINLRQSDPSTPIAAPLDTRILIVTLYRTKFRIVSRLFKGLGYADIDYAVQEFDVGFQEKIVSLLVNAKRNNNPYGLVLAFDEGDMRTLIKSIKDTSEISETPALAAIPQYKIGTNLERDVFDSGADATIATPFNSETLKSKFIGSE